MLSRRSRGLGRSQVLDMQFESSGHPKCGKTAWRRTSGAPWRRMQYGAEALDDAKIAALAAQFFETLAQLCRGRVPHAKERHNLELVGLVKMIEEHQTEPLSAEDLRRALTA